MLLFHIHSTLPPLYDEVFHVQLLQWSSALSFSLFGSLCFVLWESMEGLLIVLYLRLAMPFVFIVLFCIGNTFNFVMCVAVWDGSFLGIDFGQIILLSRFSLDIYSWYIITTILVDGGIINIRLPWREDRVLSEQTFLNFVLYHILLIKPIYYLNITLIAES